MGSEAKNLTKIGFITLLGLISLLVFIYWLKGHKIHYYDRFTFYFKNTNGLEPGASLHWNGLKIGVVESIKPVQGDFTRDPIPADKLIDLGYLHLNEAKKILSKSRIEDLPFAREKVNQAQLEIALGNLSKIQSKIRQSEHIKVEVIVTKKDVPISSLNFVTIVPSGLIGEQYVDISTLNLEEENLSEIQSTERPQFVVLEPIRLDRLLRVNVESSESIRNLANRLNVLFKDQDAENIRKLIKSLGDISSDLEFQKNVKESAKNIREFSENPKLWDFLF
jgi:ABC-type transporter Mla subunit MlaD